MKSSHLALVSILVIAAIARSWGIDFGLPHTECRPDESVVIENALGFFSGDLNPHFFRYPTLYMYMLFALYGGYFLLGTLSGRYSSVDDLRLELVLDPTNFYLMDRLLVAFLGTATVFVTFKIAQVLFRDNRVAITSAFFLSVAYLHVRDSHFGVTDVPMTFLITCSMLAIVKAYEHGEPIHYIAAGILAGLATSTKYAGILLVLPMAVVHLCHAADARLGLRAWFFDRRLVIFGIVLVLAFLLGTPFALLDPSPFLSDFAHEMGHLGRGHAGLNSERGWTYHLRVSLFVGVGWTLFSASIVGALVLLRRDLRKALVLGSFPVVYYILVGRGYTVFVRYAIPLIPFVCIAAAVSVTALSSWLKRHYGSAVATGIAVVSSILIVAPSVNNVIRFDSLLAKKDNRVVAMQWINENVPAGSSIFHAGSKWGRLQWPPTLEALEKDYEARVAEGADALALEARLKAKSRYWEKKKIRGYDRWYYDALAGGKFIAAGEEQDELPSYIIVEESPLSSYSRAPDEIKGTLASSYHLVKSFRAIDVEAAGNLFDQQDAFYVPLAGFEGVDRPGPNIHVYEKVAE